MISKVVLASLLSVVALSSLADATISTGQQKWPYPTYYYQPDYRNQQQQYAQPNYQGVSYPQRGYQPQQSYPQRGYQPQQSYPQSGYQSQQSNPQSYPQSGYQSQSNDYDLMRAYAEQDALQKYYQQLYNQIHQRENEGNANQLTPLDTSTSSNNNGAAIQLAVGSADKITEEAHKDSAEKVEETEKISST